VAPSKAMLAPPRAAGLVLGEADQAAWDEGAQLSLEDALRLARRILGAAEPHHGAAPGR